MSPSIKHRIGGAWVDGGGPTHAKVSGAFQALAAAPSVPPEFRTDSAVATGSQTTILTVTIPAAVQVGDLMVVGHVARFNSSTSTVPTGWNQLHASNIGGFGTYSTFFKFAEVGDVGGSSTVELSHPSGLQHQLGVFGAYSGVASSGPVDVSDLTFADATGTGASPSLTTTAANTLVVRIGALVRDSTLSIPAPTVPPTARRTRGIERLAIGLSDAVQETAGSTGTANFVSGVWTGTWYNAALALKAA